MNQHLHPQFDDIDLNNPPEYEDTTIETNNTTTANTITVASTTSTNTSPKCSDATTQQAPVFHININLSVPDRIGTTININPQTTIPSPVSFQFNSSPTNSFESSLVKIENTRTSGKPLQPTVVKKETLVRPVTDKPKGIVKSERKLKTEKQIISNTQIKPKGLMKMDPKAEEQNQKARENSLRQYYSIPNKHLNDRIDKNRQKKL